MEPLDSLHAVTVAELERIRDYAVKNPAGYATTIQGALDWILADPRVAVLADAHPFASVILLALRDRVDFRVNIEKRNLFEVRALIGDLIRTGYLRRFDPVRAKYRAVVPYCFAGVVYESPWAVTSEESLHVVPSTCGGVS